MSWKKIFKAARRLGTPVIIADEMGDDPFVVMTLSKYESLLDENEMAELMLDDDEPLELNDEDFEDIEDSEDIGLSHVHEDLDPRLEKVFEDQFVHGMEDLAKQKENFMETPSVEPISERQESPKTKQEMPLEDRFYFEPLDDEFKKEY